MLRTRRIGGLLALLVGIVATGVVPSVIASPRIHAPVKVRVTVAVIDDLTPKPVPLWDFVLRKKDSTEEPRKVRTDEQGVIEVELEAGEYELESVRPLTYKDRSLTWKVPVSVKGDGPVELKFTDADAVARRGARQVSPEGQLFHAVRDGVVTIEAGAGHGSGFVVDERGLILTNQHVTQKSPHVAVRFGKGIRLPATIVAEDEQSDTAVVRFNPASFSKFVVLKLADFASGPVAVEGERVIAIGSPLHQDKIMTVGIVSKAEEDVILSDVNINPGNSGGPLLNIDGEVIGICTFVDPGRGTPGVAGIVHIKKAQGVLDTARSKLEQSSPPPATLLPDVPEPPIPTEALAKAARSGVKDPPIIRSPRNFETLIYTPFYLASEAAWRERQVAKGMERRAQKRAGKGEKEGFQFNPVAYWTKYVGQAEPLIIIEVRPALKETSGSQVAGVFGAIFGVRTTKQMEFRDDFYDMELVVDGQKVEPVRKFRILSDVLYEGWDMSVSDAAYGGRYMYDPRVFDPNKPTVLRVRKSSNLERWDEIRLDKRQIQRIVSEMEPWYQVASK